MNIINWAVALPYVDFCQGHSRSGSQKFDLKISRRKARSEKNSPLDALYVIGFPITYHRVVSDYVFFYIEFSGKTTAQKFSQGHSTCTGSSTAHVRYSIHY